MFNSIIKKDIDLLAAYNRKTEPSRYAPILKMAILPLCLVLIFSSIFAFQQFRIASINSEIETTNKQIDDYNKKIAASGSEAYDLYIQMANKNENIETLIENIRSYPRLSTNLMNIYFNNLLNGLSMSSITYTDGVVSLSASATNVLTIENFVRKLRATSLFAVVDYSGYETVEKSETISSDKDDIDDVTISSKTYVFQVTCVLKGVE